MITRTIREALLADETVIPGYVYVARDGNTVFYVGISKNPTLRLAQHVGIANGWDYTIFPEKLIPVMERGHVKDTTIVRLMPSQLGECLLINAPESLEWSFDIYEKEDAIAVVQRTGLPQIYPRLLEMMEVDWSEQRTIVENALIKELKPYLNAQLNGHGRDIPAHYRTRDVNLDDNAADYIKL